MTLPISACALTLLLALLQGASAEVSFCKTVVESLFKCPIVPTVDTVDINKYTGKWYAIATNSQFALALFGDQGGQCVIANYTAVGEVNGQQNVKVVNKARIVNSYVRQAQSYGISQTTAAVSLGVRLLCLFLEGDGTVALPLMNKAKTVSLTWLLDSTKGQAKSAGAGADAGAGAGAGASPMTAVVMSEALKIMQSSARPHIETMVRNSMKMASSYGKMSAAAAAAGTPPSVSSLAASIAAATAASTKLTPGAKLKIAKEIAAILVAVGKVSVEAGAIFDELATIQTDNFVLSGSTLLKPYSTKTTVSDIKTNSGSIGAHELAIMSLRKQILMSSIAIEKAAAADLQIVVKAGLISSLAAPVGPISLASSDILAGSKVISLVASVIMPEPIMNRSITAVGNAVQNASQPGALQVSFGGQGSGAYNIIKLDGPAATGYDIALVFGCSADITTALLPQNGIFILARSPSIPQAAIDASLAFAAQKGIFLAGDNAVVTISQDPKLCKGTW